jgi:hypothetical protein
MPVTLAYDSEKGLRPIGSLAASLACAIAVNDPALGQVVGRHFQVDPVARQNFDAVAPQASRNVGQDRVAVFEFDREGRARKDLLDRTEQLKRRLLDRLVVYPGGVGGFGFGSPAPSSYDRAAF